MNGLYDIHCHILPGVDDGADNIDIAIQLLQKEYEDGVRTVILTPHYRKRMFEVPMARIYDAFDDLVYEARDLGIDLYLGCEYHVNMDMADMLLREERPTMAGSRYVLCEFSESAEASFIKERGYHLINKGLVPIFAHIERYSALTKDFDLIEEMADLGCMMQVNAGSILGEDGRTPKQFCRKLIQYDLLDLIGSDAHDLNKRAPLLGECVRYLEKKMGRVYTSRILRDNPSRIIYD